MKKINFKNKEIYYLVVIMLCELRLIFFEIFEIIFNVVVLYINFGKIFW